MIRILFLIAIGLGSGSSSLWCTETHDDDIKRVARLHAARHVMRVSVQEFIDYQPVRVHFERPLAPVVTCYDQSCVTLVVGGFLASACSVSNVFVLVAALFL